MQKAPAIIDALIERPEMYQLMVSESTRQIPGSVHYTMKRFIKPTDWMQEDTGMVKYYYESANASLPWRFTNCDNTVLVKTKLKTLMLSSFS